MHGSNPKSTNKAYNHLCDSHYTQYNLMCNIQTTEQRMSRCLNVLGCYCWWMLKYLHIQLHVWVYLHTRVCVCQVALRTMCGCIARVCFVLLRFTGVVVERQQRGGDCESVDAGRWCVFVCLQWLPRFPSFIVRHFWGTLEQEEHPSENSAGPKSRTNNHYSLEKLSTWT